MLRRSVADYTSWKAFFADHGGARANAGILGQSGNTLADDDNYVVAYVQSADMADVGGMLDDPNMKEAMERAGVTGPPTFTFLNHVGMKQYA